MPRQRQAILIVDDSEMNRSILADMLGDGGRSRKSSEEWRIPLSTKTNTKKMKFLKKLKKT